MSFEFEEAYGFVRRVHPRSVVVDSSQSSIKQNGRDFIDLSGIHYSGAFDGKNIVFRCGDTEYIARWMQGTAATAVRGNELILPGFIFIFMDHGRPPQRLHAQWTFNGPVVQAIRLWQLAGFSISYADRYINRNHVLASVHLRTKGSFATGADSSHAIVYCNAAGATSSGEIHVGEFNPMTGFGVGFLLHLTERWR